MRGLLTVLAVATLAGPALAQNPVPAAVPTQAESRHEGYYYPKLTSRETYVARARQQPGIERAARLAFFTGLSQAQMSRPHAPAYALFAKGENAQKAILVALGEDGFRTLFQGRALLAQMTTVARASELMRELKVEDLFTFYDVLRLFGFDEIVISDGRTFAHRVTLK